MRIDKLLWFLRLAKTRSAAQALVAQAHIRLNGRRVERCAQGVAVGDVLVLPWGDGARVIEILALPARRGPASEARPHYRELGGGAEQKSTVDETRAFSLAAAPIKVSSERNLQP